MSCHTLKGFPVASSSSAARIENDDNLKIDDPFDFAQNRHVCSKSCSESHHKRISIASNSLVARVEIDDIRKIDDPFDFAQNRYTYSKSFPESYSKDISRCIQ